MVNAFRVRLYSGFAVAIIICIISGITSYVILKKEENQRVWVREARNILDSASSIQNKIIEMGNSRIQFRATGQKQFLEPYYRDLNRIIPALDKLKELVADDSDVKAIDVALEQNVYSLLQFWKLNGDDSGKYAQNDITKLTDDEKVKIDQVRSLILELQRNETKLLTRRREDYDQLIHYDTISTILESIISLVITLILIYIIIIEFNSRSKMQEQLHESVEQLKDQTQSLQKSEADLKYAMEELGTINKQLEKFAYTVAHDIKSPLYGIISALDMVRVEDTIVEDAKLLKLLDLSSDAAVHLSNMVDFLLEYSRISLIHQEPETVNVKELLEQLVVLLFPPGNISIHIQENVPVFSTRKLKIMQVFQNLISNAIKYNDKATGHIDIGYTEERDYFTFFVKDNGQGIKENFKDKIFNMTRTADNKAKIDSSTGFGLGIAKLIIEEQGGRIWFDSVVGQGTTFYFEWKK